MKGVGVDFVTLTDLEGRRARVELLSQQGGQQLLRLEDGRTVSLPEDALVKQHTGDYYLLLKLSELEASADALSGSNSASERTDEMVIPVAEERLKVRKRRVDGATVRVTKEVHEEEQVVDEPLFSEEVDVRRVRVDRVVDAPEPIRSEGDTTVIPLYEEVLVVEKRLVLTEELHVTRQRVERREPQRVTLRRESASVERLEPDEGVRRKESKK